jgi:multidrug efflux pump subunit AcrA (membrane-fusion protein)
MTMQRFKLQVSSFTFSELFPDNMKPETRNQKLQARNRESRTTFHERRATVLLVAFVLAGLLGCERTPDQAAEPKKAVVAERPGVLRLTAEELSRTAIEVAPVARGALLVPRQYTATVQANENELAEVTTLIRGRVEKVYVDVGQDVKKDALLALLHSTDLGVAEGTYLKFRKAARSETGVRARQGPV